LGHSYRLANVDELAFTTPGVALRVQTSRDVELGTRFKTPTAEFDLRWYQNKLTDEIGYDPKAIGPYSSWGFQGANVNLGPTQRQGLEWDARYDVQADWRLRLNAALREAKFVSGSYAGKSVALVPKATVALQLDWRFLPGHFLNSRLNWVAAQYPDFDNACRMPAYTSVALQYGYQFQQVAFLLGVNNLTNRKYYTLAYGCAAGVPSDIYPEAGRAVTASVRWRF
jgi:iron complex outermembrane receptor protein